MNNRFDNDNAADPSVHKIVGIKGDTQQRNEWVVSTSQDKQGNHVQKGQVSRSASKLSDQRCFVVGTIIQDRAVGHLAEKVACQQHCVEPGGQSAHIDSLGQLELAVVPFASQGCVEDMLLDV